MQITAVVMAYYSEWKAMQK